MRSTKRAVNKNFSFFLSFFLSFFYISNYIWQLYSTVQKRAQPINTANAPCYSPGLYIFLLQRTNLSFNSVVYFYLGLFKYRIKSIKLGSQACSRGKSHFFFTHSFCLLTKMSFKFRKYFAMSGLLIYLILLLKWHRILVNGVLVYEIKTTI